MWHLEHIDLCLWLYKVNKLHLWKPYDMSKKYHVPHTHRHRHEKSRIYYRLERERERADSDSDIVLRKLIQPLLSVQRT